MLQTARPPHIRFEKRAAEDRAASIEAGHIIYHDIDYVIITPPGGKDVVEKIAKEWIADIQRRSHIGQYDVEWAERFAKMYAMWQKDEELPEHGTPLKTSLMFTPAEIMACTGVNIHTLEDLAGANEEALGRIGMGARNMKQRAQAALESVKGDGALAIKLAAVQEENAELHAKLLELRGLVNELRAQSEKSGKR